MQTSEPTLLRELAGDLELELAKLDKLRSQVQKLEQNISEALATSSRFMRV